MQHRLWQRTFLIIAGLVELGIGVISVVMVFLLGYHGFAAGEMGTMVGLFAVAGLLFLLPYAVARTLTVLGIWKKRRWAGILVIVLSVLLALLALVVVTVAPLLSVAIVLYASFSIWASIMCLRHPDFAKTKRPE